MRKILGSLAVAAGLLAVAGPAAAHSGISVGITLGIPAPVYVAPPPPVYYPRPVYVAPPPVVYAPPPPVYYGPTYYAPRYYAPRGYYPPSVVYRSHRPHRGWDRRR